MIPLTLGGFLSGVNPRLSEMSSVMRGLSALSYTRWSTEALGILELRTAPPHQAKIVENAYESIGWDPNGLGIDYAVLVGTGVAFRLLTWIALKFMHRDKRA